MCQKIDAAGQKAVLNLAEPDIPRLAGRRGRSDLDRSQGGTFPRIASEDLGQIAAGLPRLRRSLYCSSSQAAAELAALRQSSPTSPDPTALLGGAQRNVAERNKHHSK